ncbi:hypothetical protein [Deinococcus kurensis]|uniref:hypothetical protein n=1 Tax=Deinococcus kurensis TaxID=2662757 RepID=UPI0012D33972|nr:hypothetical protein [Deinococcus kurensis]
MTLDDLTLRIEGRRISEQFTSGAWAEFGPMRVTSANLHGATGRRPYVTLENGEFVVLQTEQVSELAQVCLAAGIPLC